MAFPPSTMRIPAQHIDAEKALLGSVILRPEALYEIIDIVSARAFYVEKHRLVFEAMLELMGKSEPIDLLSLSARLREKGLIDNIGGASYLSEMVGLVPSAANIGHYAQLVHRKYMLRELI